MKAHAVACNEVSIGTGFGSLCRASMCFEIHGEDREKRSDQGDEA